MRLLTLAATAVLGAALLPAGTARADDGPACTTTFTAAVDDSWSTPGSWTAGVPTSTSIACTTGHGVVVSGGDQHAAVLRGSGVTVSGGNLSLGSTTEPSSLGSLTVTGGSFSNAAELSLSTLQATGSSHLAFTGRTDVYGPSTFDGTGATVLSGFVHLGEGGSITNPGFTLEGTAEIGVRDALSLASGIVVHHTGTGHAHIDAESLYYQGNYLSLPSSGRSGFEDTDLTLTSLAIPAGLTFVASDLALPCVGEHGAFVCPGVSGAGVLETDGSTISGPGPVRPGDDGDLTILGGATITAPIEVTPAHHIAVVGAPVTFSGAARVPTDEPLPAGTAVTVLTDPAGLTRTDDVVEPLHGFTSRTTPTTYSLVANAPTTITVTHTPAGALAGTPVTFHATVTSTGGGPVGGELGWRVPCSSPYDPLPVAAEVVDGQATFTSTHWSDCNGPGPGPRGGPFQYLGDDTHAPSDYVEDYVSQEVAPLQPTATLHLDDGTLTVTVTPDPSEDPYNEVDRIQVTVGGQTVAGPAGTPLTVTGLAPGTTYDVRSAAVNDTGPGAADVQTISTPAAPPTPAAPTPPGTPTPPAISPGISLSTSATSAPAGRTRMLSGTVTGGVGTVAVQRVLPSGRAVGWAHVWTDAQGRWHLPVILRQSTTVRVAITVDGTLVTSPPVALTVTPVVRDLSARSAGGRLTITAVVGGASPGTPLSVVACDRDGQHRRSLGPLRRVRVAHGVRVSLSTRQRPSYIVVVVGPTAHHGGLTRVLAV